MTSPVNHKLVREAFADRLRNAMFERRIGAEKLAEKSGVSFRLIRKYLAADSSPLDYFGDPTANAHKLAEGLGVDVSVLAPRVERMSNGAAA